MAHDTGKPFSVMESIVCTLVYAVLPKLRRTRTDYPCMEPMYLQLLGSKAHFARDSSSRLREMRQLQTQGFTHSQKPAITYSSTAHKARYRPVQTPCQSRYLSLGSQQLAPIPKPNLGIDHDGVLSTSRYDLAFSPPLPQHRKEERQRIRNRDREAQFCKEK